MEDRSGDIMPERKIQISISEEKLALSQDLVQLVQFFQQIIRRLQIQNSENEGNNLVRTFIFMSLK